MYLSFDDCHCPMLFCVSWVICICNLGQKVTGHVILLQEWQKQFCHSLTREKKELCSVEPPLVYTTVVQLLYELLL